MLTELNSANHPTVQEETTVPIGRAEALHLIRASGGELPELLAAAREARDRFKPGVITYSRKVFIPLTNLCRDYCGYCTFRRDPGQPGAHTMTPEEVLAVAQRAKSWVAPKPCSAWATSPNWSFPKCARPCAAGITTRRCIISKPCANWCCARPLCCRIPIPA